MLFAPESASTTGTNTQPIQPNEIRIVLNWFEELKRLSPVK
jgi:hypothetical protein